MEFNRQNIKAEKAEAEEKLRKFNSDVLRKDEEEKEINEVISVLNAKREQSRSAIDEQERHLTGKKIELAALEEKKEADLRTISRLQNDISSMENENNGLKGGNRFLRKSDCRINSNNRNRTSGAQGTLSRFCGAGNASGRKKGRHKIVKTSN